MDPPETASYVSGGSCDPPLCLNMTLLQPGVVSLCSPKWVQEVRWVLIWGAAPSGCLSPKWAGEKGCLRRRRECVGAGGCNQDSCLIIPMK